MGEHLAGGALDGGGDVLEGEDGEGLLDLQAELLHAEEEEADEAADGDERGGAAGELGDEGEGEEEDPEAEEAARVAGVDERDGHAADALARDEGPHDLRRDGGRRPPPRKPPTQRAQPP